MEKIKIFASYFKESYRVSNDIFQPIQGGRDVLPYVLDNMIGDNTGDNISIKQPLYSDLTPHYWVLKNYIDTCDEAYIGNCHYRRTFSFKKPRTWRNIKEKLKYNLAVYLMPFINKGGSLISWDAHYVHEEKDFQKHIDEFTSDIKEDIQTGNYFIYAYKPVRFSGMKMQLLFESRLSVDLLELFKQILRTKYPEFSEVFEETCNSRALYYSNCFIMRKDLYKKNMIILFDLIFEHEKQCVEKGFLKDPINEKIYFRCGGYLSEIMISTFILYYLKTQKKNVKLLHGVLFNYA